VRLISLSFQSGILRVGFVGRQAEGTENIFPATVWYSGPSKTYTRPYAPQDPGSTMLKHALDPEVKRDEKHE